MAKNSGPRRHFGPIPAYEPPGKWVWWYRLKGSAEWKATTETPSWLDTNLYEIQITSGPPPWSEPPPAPKKKSADQRRSEFDRRFDRPPSGMTAYQRDQARWAEQEAQPPPPPEPPRIEYQGRTVDRRPAWAIVDELLKKLKRGEK